PRTHIARGRWHRASSAHREHRTPDPPAERATATRKACPRSRVPARFPVTTDTSELSPSGPATLSPATPSSRPLPPQRGGAHARHRQLTHQRKADGATRAKTRPSNARRMLEVRGTLDRQV